MDWNKSNIVLIIAFLIINAFLIFSIVNHESDEDREAIYISRVENLLEEKGIKISCEIPKAYDKAPFLELEYKNIVLTETMIMNFLPDFSGEFYDNVFTYSSDTASLTRIGNNKLVYEKEDGEEVIKIIDEKDDLQVIYNFCLAHDIDMENFVYEAVYKENDHMVYEFKESYEGFLIENSYIKFCINDAEVCRFEMQTVENIIKKAEEDMISPYEAIIRVLVDENNYNKDIVEIKACYYSESPEGESSLDYFDSDLVWKLVFSDGSYYYLDGFY